MTLEQQQALARARSRAALEASEQAGGGLPPTPAQQTPSKAVEVPSEAWNSPRRLALAKASEEQNVVSGQQGMKDAVLKSALGIKQLFGGLSDEDKTVLKAMQEDAAADPNQFARKRGDIGGSILTTMLPAAGAASKVASLAKYLPQALRFLTPAATAATVSGGQGALLNVGEGSTYGEQMADKGKQAAVDAALGGALAGGGQLLTKGATQAFTPSAETVNFIKEGITPTLQQGAESKIGRLIGGLTSGAFDTSKRQNEEILTALMKRIMPKLDTSGMAMPEKISLLEKTLGDEATALMGGKNYSLSRAERSAIWGAPRNTPQIQSEAVDLAQGQLGKAGDALNAKNNIPVMGYGKMEQNRRLLDDVRQQIGQEGEINQQTREALKRAKDIYDKTVRTRGMSADEVAQLSDIDRRMYDFARLEDAAKSPGFHQNPKLSDVMRSYSSMAEGTDFANAANQTQRELLEPASRMLGMTPKQNESRAMVTAMRRGWPILASGTVGGAPGMAALAPLYAASLAGQTVGGAKFLMGQTGAQKAIAEAIRKMAPLGAGAGQILGEDYAP